MTRSKPILLTCTTCGGCERFGATYEDCSGNVFPTCGGCLWSQGFVQCP